MRVPQHVSIEIDLAPGAPEQYRVHMGWTWRDDRGIPHHDERVWITRPSESGIHNATVINTLIGLVQSQLPALVDEIVFPHPLDGKALDV
jgi:hypothetical protein